MMHCNSRVVFACGNMCGHGASLSNASKKDSLSIRVTAWRVQLLHGFVQGARESQILVTTPSWAALGAVLGALGAVLEPSWAPLGALLGHLGAILRPQEPIGSEKARRQKTLIFL